MWLFPISEVSCTDTARRGGVGKFSSGRPYNPMVMPCRGGYCPHDPPCRGGYCPPEPRDRWYRPRVGTSSKPDPKIAELEAQLKALKAQQAAEAKITQSKIDALTLSSKSAANMPLQPSPEIPLGVDHVTTAPPAQRAPDGSVSGGQQRRRSVRKPYNWRKPSTNVRY